MKHDVDTAFPKTYRGIKRQFGFLFESGFRIASFSFNGQGVEGWQITMHKGDYLIKLYARQGKISLALSTLELYEKNVLFDLEDMAAYLAGSEGLFRERKNPPMEEAKQFKRIAWLLEKYFELILEQIRKSEQLLIRHGSFSDVEFISRRWSDDHRLLYKTQG